MTTERRKMPRQRTLLGGRIVFNQRRATLDCVVRNFSDAGALILLSDAVALPSAFDLEIDHKQRSYGARIRWRNGERIGLVFADQAATDAEIVPLDIARRLRMCEQNNAQLKARIAQLSQAG
ncbi:PilZ domain-containing protein [Bosea caraganae]|uniref:PilZ domain-containing protein n=1 Tax=Bosea caraganae TaxID=2763117 RepID=A0A370L3R9_9HYPH|nr:PilZ domain-containing protein [Bosea caraganae]RDJ23051.1 PilZ domain-containing protein [Bosea caraganae]RDJ28831.1 PilZ domain-containing protein [Bosea caraganae]